MYAVTCKEDFNKVFATKVYIVFQRDNVAREGEPNIKVIACKLNYTAAQAVVDKCPGSYIQKVFGNRVPDLTQLAFEVRGG